MPFTRTNIKFNHHYILIMFYRPIFHIFSGLQVWDRLLTSTSEPVRRKVLEDHLPLWFHMMGAPSGLNLDPTLFLDPPKGGVLTIPVGVREYRVRCSLYTALGRAAQLTNLSLFSPHVTSLLESGCASHKQVVYNIQYTIQ